MTEMAGVVCISLCVTAVNDFFLIKNYGESTQQRVRLAPPFFPFASS
jgi:hypothetical protein